MIAEIFQRRPPTLCGAFLGRELEATYAKSAKADRRASAGRSTAPVRGARGPGGSREERDGTVKLSMAITWRSVPYWQWRRLGYRCRLISLARSAELDCFGEALIPHCVPFGDLL